MQQSKIQWKLIALSYISLFGLSLIDNGRGPIYPTLLDLLQLNTSQGSYLFSIASIIGVLVNLTARWWLYWLGSIGATRYALFFLALGSFCLAASGKLTSYPLLLLSAFLLGIGLSVCTISMNVLVAQGTPLDKRRNVFAGLHSIYGIASFMVPFLIMGITKLSYSWIHFFILVGLGCLVAILWSLLVHSSEVKLQTKKELVVPAPYKKRLLFGFILAFYVGSEITISSRLVLFLERARNFSSQEAGLYLSFFFICLLAGRLLFTFIKVSLPTHMLLFTSLILTTISFAIGYLVHPIGVALCGLSMSFFFPMAMDWLAGSFPRGMEFMTASAMTSISLVLGVMHWGFGRLADHYGVQYAMLIAPTCSILSLVCLYLWNKQQNSTIISPS